MPLRDDAPMPEPGPASGGQPPAARDAPITDAALRHRLWDGFARLQTLLGGTARKGEVITTDGLVASVVPAAPDSPALNAAVAIDPQKALEHFDELARRYEDAGVRRWGIWLDGAAAAITNELARQGCGVASASPGMGAVLDELDLADAPVPLFADLPTVGRVNDLAYGNPDARLERTLEALPQDALHAYRADDERGRPAAVALALHHEGDCGLSFVATVPDARRSGLATRVMMTTLYDAEQHGLTTATLQATPEGQRLYETLGFRPLGSMELWERRP